MRLIRIGLPAALLAVALVLPALVSAHAELVSTSPEAGANLDEPPTEVVMTFETEINRDGSEFTVTDAAGNTVGTGEVDLDVAERNEMRGDVEISEPGVYTVAWTTVAEDGFEESGVFTFGYAADPPAPSSSEQPNTAVSASPTTGGGGLVVAGLALLCAALVSAAVWRHSAVRITRS